MRDVWYCVYRENYKLSFFNVFVVVDGISLLLSFQFNSIRSTFSLFHAVHPPLAHRTTTHRTNSEREIIFNVNIILLTTTTMTTNNQATMKFIHDGLDLRMAALFVSRNSTKCNQVNSLSAYFISHHITMPLLVLQYRALFSCK